MERTNLLFYVPAIMSFRILTFLVACVSELCFKISFSQGVRYL